jgi:hypothetical protein
LPMNQTGIVDAKRCAPACIPTKAVEHAATTPQRLSGAQAFGILHRQRSNDLS